MGARPSLDVGDYDSSDVQFAVPDVRHLSHRPAALPPEPAAKTDIGIEYLKSLRQRSASPVAATPTRRPVNITCWKDTPQLYRRMLARVAGLSADVVEKIDRDLTETEKAMLRSAASDLRDHLNALVSI